MNCFNALCEAYEVLSDSTLKGIYDKNGCAGLKNIGTKTNGKFRGGYAYMGNSFDIFERFHGNKSPFTDNFCG